MSPDATDNTAWFVHDRFGMFLHWGLYTLGARQEWVKSLEQIEDKEYDEKYYEHFEPDLYDPVKWARAAKEAGMKYFVITTKHHEGFCLWDSEWTDYKATNTLAGRDLLKPLVEAFRNEGLRVGFYYSLIDWHHPDFIVDDKYHPRRDDNLPVLNKGRSQARYAEYLHKQVRELLTDFGKIDILWFDFSYPSKSDPADFSSGKGRLAWRSEELYQMIRELQPGIILNDRMDLNDQKCWDVKTPENFQPRSWYTIDGEPVVWEACQTLGRNWGYVRDESYRSPRDLIGSLIDCVSMGGNLLLNVGPTGRGEFDPQSVERLRGIGRWMHLHGRSIYGCTQAPEEFSMVENAKLTYNPETNRLYIHILSWPLRHVHLDGMVYVQGVEYAQFLHDASEIPIRSVENWQMKAALNAGFDPENAVTLELPLVPPDVTIPVIELFLKEIGNR